MRFLVSSLVAVVWAATPAPLSAQGCGPTRLKVSESI